MAQRKSRNPYEEGGSGNAVAFLDVFLNSMATFVTMCVLLFLLVIAQAKNKNQSEKPPGYSEGVYRITMSWPGELSDDVDLYVQDPAGNIVFFNKREAGLMHLEHDDLGSRNDRTTDAEGKEVTLDQNIEHVILRATMPGEYTVNAHMYRMASDSPVVIHVRLSKSAGDETVKERNVTLFDQGDETTAFRFTLDQKAAVSETNELEKSLTGSRGNAERNHLGGGGMPPDGDPFSEGD